MGTSEIAAPIALSVTVLAEARELLSALRRNRRFGYLLSFATPSHPAEHPLVKEVKSLRDVVRIPVTPTSPNNFNQLWADGVLIAPDALLNALDPFFEVVKSRDASGIITGVALQSLDRIASRLVSIAEPRGLLSHYASVLSAVVDAAAQCRFDATDPASDEVVLARITNVISTVGNSPALAHLADASILRSVEACLGIASGRRRASELLKRTADAALVDLLRSLGQQLPTILSQKSASAVTAGQPVVAEGVSGPAFGYALDSDSFQQHGPASVAIAAALIELCARMADPSFSQNASERALGLTLMSTLLSSGGPALRSHRVLKQLLLRDCCRGILRSLGLFQAPPTIVAASFTTAVQLVHVLQEDGAPFLLALLDRVYPYYISGYENVLPKTTADPETVVNSESAAPASNGNGNASSGSSGSLEAAAVEIDPVIREIGLESLAALLATPGLLCMVYRLADCDMRRTDIVHPLLKALGNSSKTQRFRRRSKRLRASSSGNNRAADPTGEVESDDEDDMGPTGGGSAESSRFSRASALLCAESVLAVIDTISDRLKLETAGLAKPPEMDYKALQAARLVRKQKLRLQEAAEIFNGSEKMNKSTKVLAMLREHGLVESNRSPGGNITEDLEDDVRAIVCFLRDTPGLNKEKVGVILGEPDSLSRRVLADYTATFEFEDRAFTESLRVYLESFRLPGEAQKIDRIVESFASRYFSQNRPTRQESPEFQVENDGSTTAQGDVQNGERTEYPAQVSQRYNGKHDQEPDAPSHKGARVLKNAEAAYVFTFSVVMLNTDQHNESVRKKMTLEDFVKNCRGINDNEDLPRWFLVKVFDSIAAVEIRMSDEAGIGALTSLLWDEHLKDLEVKERMPPSMKTSRVFDEDLFLLSWEAGVVAANSILNEAGDANSVQKALEGFLSVARCATSYRISRPTDAVISSLCTATTIRDGPLYGAVARFGTDIKAQMASVALSGVSRQCGDWLQIEGWQALVAYLLRLHALCLLPVELEQELGGYGAELVNVQKEGLPPSRLIPAWWPSKTSKSGSTPDDEKPKKAPRANGFFAAILAASRGSEIDSDEEDEDEHLQFSSGHGPGPQRVSHVAPHYIRMRTREDNEAQDLARKCVAGCRIEDVIINEAKVLQSSALDFLAKAIARSAGRILDFGKSQAGNGEAQEEDVRPPNSEDSVLNWTDISPPSPRNDSSTISGVMARHRAALASEGETEYSAFALSPTWEGVIRERDERKAREFVTAFCVDVLCELTLQNRDRLHIPWPALQGLIVRIIAPATQPSPTLERAVVALLRVGVRLLHREEVRDDVLRGLNLLVRLPSGTAQALAIPIAAGVYNIVNTHGSEIQSTSGWHAILSILENTARCEPEAREIGLETISCVLKDQYSTDAVSSETFAPLLEAILAYTSCSSVDVSVRALELLYLLSQRLCSITTAVVSANKETPGKVRSAEATRADNEMWSEYWGPLFLGFASAVRDARGKVRNAAIGVLERVIASGSSAEFLSANQWSHALSTVILPLMTKLFSTHGFLAGTVEAERNAQKKLFAERSAAAASGRGRSRSFFTSPEHDEQLLRSVIAACNRTRMRAVVLTSKTFLQHHAAIADGLSEDAFTQLWIGVLEVFRVAVESGTKGIPELQGLTGEGRPGEGDDLREHVPESVKNLLLVMCDCGLLSPRQHVRWNATFAVVRKFVPDVESIISAATQEPTQPPKPNLEETGFSVASDSKTTESNYILAEKTGMDENPPEPSVPVASTT